MQYSRGQELHCIALYCIFITSYSAVQLKPQGPLLAPITEDNGRAASVECLQSVQGRTICSAVKHSAMQYSTFKCITLQLRASHPYYRDTRTVLQWLCQILKRSIKHIFQCIITTCKIYIYTLLNYLIKIFFTRYQVYRHCLLSKKIPHTGDIESLYRCGS